MSLYHEFHRLTLLVGLLLCVQTPSLALGDTLKDHRQVENDHYSVALIREEPDPEFKWANRYVFQVVDKEQASRHTIVLKDHKPPLNETHVNLSLLDNQLMIRTQSQRRPISPTTIDLFSLPDCRLLEDFVCYSPVVSPASRYIVYERFFPPHGLPGSQDCVVLVYDLTLSATDNRLPVVGMTNWKEAMVGFPIYPPICSRLRRYRIVPDASPEELGGVNSPMLWQGVDQVVFLTGRYDGCHVVRIDLKKGPLNPAYYHGPVLSPTECVKPGYELKAKQQLPFAFLASDLVWDGSDAVIVKPNWWDYLKPEIRVPIP